MQISPCFFSSLSASVQQGLGLQCLLTGSSGTRQLLDLAPRFASRPRTLAAWTWAVSPCTPLKAWRDQGVAWLLELDFDLHDDSPDRKAAPEMQSGPDACAARAARIRPNRPVLTVRFRIEKASWRVRLSTIASSGAEETNGLASSHSGQKKDAWISDLTVEWTASGSF
jgi:hypothetical protein